MTLADINQDGNLDAVCTDDYGATIDIAFGDGQGGFSSDEILSAGDNADPANVQVADLNGDGIPDLVGGEVNTMGNNLYVFLGTGGGQFQAPINFAGGGFEPNALAVGDMNNDGIPDLVVMNIGDNQPPLQANLTVLLGKGNGTFGKPAIYRAGTYPYGLALGDFKEDGNLDVSLFTETTGPGILGIYLGNGTGKLSPGKVYQNVAFGSPVATDMNSDGILDLVGVTGVTPGYAEAALGNGNATFQRPQLFSVGDGPQQAIVADFNGDGKPDIATVNSDAETVSILLNTTPFPPRPPLPRARARSRSL